jgi:hypothetical protein
MRAKLLKSRYEDYSNKLWSTGVFSKWTNIRNDDNSEMRIKTQMIKIPFADSTVSLFTQRRQKSEIN